MTKALAERLREAGFPQSWPKPDYMELHDSLAISDILAKYENENDPYIPTLEELIRACGVMFKKLERITSDYWKAESVEVMDIKVGFQGGGETESEAVAYLWLAVNKEKDGNNKAEKINV